MIELYCHSKDHQVDLFLFLLKKNRVHIHCDASTFGTEQRVRHCARWRSFLLVSSLATSTSSLVDIKGLFWRLKSWKRVLYPPPLLCGLFLSFLLFFTFNFLERWKQAKELR